jgi:hypothetical protein
LPRGPALAGAPEDACRRLRLGKALQAQVALAPDTAGVVELTPERARCDDRVPASRVRQARGQDDVAAEEAAIVRDRPTRVQADAHADALAGIAAPLLREPALQADRTGERLLGLVEGE